MQTANITITLDTTVQPSDTKSGPTKQLTQDTSSTSLTNTNTLNAGMTTSSSSTTSIRTTLSENMIQSSTNTSIPTTSIQSTNLNDTTIINNDMSTSSSSMPSPLISSKGHSHQQIQDPSTQLIYSTTLSNYLQSATSISSTIPSSSPYSSLSSSSSVIRRSSKVSVIMITTTVSPSSSSRMSSDINSSSIESVVTQTLTVTPSAPLLFSISTGSTRDYLMYTQEYLFTDSQTTFTTGLLQTTTMKKSASRITLPTGIVTKPVSYYKAYVDGSLDSSGSISSSSSHHKSVIIGSVVGSILGAAVLFLLGVLYYMFMRNKRNNNNGKFISSGKQPDLYMDDTTMNDAVAHNEKTGDPFKNEFQFNERVPGQIPVPEDPLDYSVSMRDSSDFQFNPESSIDMISNDNNGSYEEDSNAYSYTRSITDWRNDTHL